MLKKIILFIPLFILLFSNLGWASQVQEQAIVVDADTQGVAHFKVDVKYTLLTTDKLYYLVSGKVANVRASDAGGPLSCTVEKDPAGTQIACDPNIKEKTNYILKLEFDVLDSIGKTDSKQIFNYKITLSDPTESFKFGLRLPEGMVLKEPANESYIPANAVLGSTGRKVTLDWSFSPELGKSYDFIVIYEPPFGFPVPVSFEYLYYVLGAAVLIIIYFWSRAKRTTRTEAILSVLSTDEKKVLEAIMGKGATCKQRDVVKATAFSKAKISRILVALEKRGIVKKEPLGRTNRIILKDKRLVKKMK